MTDWSGFEPRDPNLEPRAPTERSPSRIVERTVALLEVLLCSDYPTQFALGTTFTAFGFAPYTSQGRLSVPYVVTLSLVVAGGVREEIQRAFLLHRFEVWLGGRGVGIVVGSAAFGAGHLLQGADAAVATGLLGVFWGIVYLRRRSVVAPVVSHSGFNVLQNAQYLLVGG